MTYVQPGEQLILDRKPRSRDEKLAEERGQVRRVDEIRRDELTLNVLGCLGRNWYHRAAPASSLWEMARFLDTTIRTEPMICAYPEREVREAVKRLQAVGLVESVRGHGWRLSDLGASALGMEV